MLSDYGDGSPGLVVDGRPMSLDVVALDHVPDAVAKVAGHGDHHRQGLAVSGHRVLVKKALHDLQSLWMV